MKKEDLILFKLEILEIIEKVKEKEQQESKDINEKLHDLLGEETPYESDRQKESR